MPDFVEYAKRYGVDNAKSAFRTGDHLVFIVRKGYVTGVCGNWRGSEPLGNPTRNPDVSTAKRRLRNAILGCFNSEETIYDLDDKTKATCYVCPNCGDINANTTVCKCER